MTCVVVVHVPAVDTVYSKRVTGNPKNVITSFLLVKCINAFENKPTNRLQFFDDRQKQKKTNKERTKILRAVGRKSYRVHLRAYNRLGLGAACASRSADGGGGGGGGTWPSLCLAVSGNGYSGDARKTVINGPDDPHPLPTILSATLYY